MAALMTLALTVLLGGCTTIDRVNVNTVAVNCDVERGEERAGAGEADSTATLRGAAQFAGLLYSTVRCADVEVEAGAETASQ